MFANTQGTLHKVLQRKCACFVCGDFATDERIFPSSLNLHVAAALPQDLGFDLFVGRECKVRISGILGMLGAASPFDSICRATAAVSSQLLHHPPTPDSKTNYWDYFADTSSRSKVGTDLQTNARDVFCRAVKQPQHAKTCSLTCTCCTQSPIITQILSLFWLQQHQSGQQHHSDQGCLEQCCIMWWSQLKWKPLQSLSWKQASLGGSQLAPHAPDADWLSPRKN